MMSELFKSTKEYLEKDSVAIIGNLLLNNTNNHPLKGSESVLKEKV